MKIIAQDTVNDITLLAASNEKRFYIRYGLSTTTCHTIAHATKEFNDCVKHALMWPDHLDEEDTEQ